MKESMMLLPVLAIRPWAIVMIVLAVVLIGALVALSIYGKKLQDKQEESKRQMEAAAQNMSLLVIDKKKMKLKESGLPQFVIEQTPKRMRGQKVPIVKAKMGGKILSMMCDEQVFAVIPVKKTVKARVAGIYILEVKGLRSELEAAGKKLPFRARMQAKLTNLQKKAQAEVENGKTGKGAKEEKKESKTRKKK